MRYIEFEEKNFTQASSDMLKKIDVVLKNYNRQGYVITLRQLYYKLFSTGVIKHNNAKEYKKLINIVNNGRVAGLLPWDMFEDTAREYNDVFTNEDRATAAGYLPRFWKADFWRRQKYYVEVWVEKNALGNVIERACKPYRVPHMSCRGYLSATQAWQAGERFEAELADGERTGVLFYLGDHDPSGVDMSRDNERRLRLFSHDADIKVQRLALTMAQINQYNPLPAPVKTTDSRAEKYTAAHGDDCWELDALEPEVIEALIVNAIKKLIDPAAWQTTLDEEQTEQDFLRRIETNWDEVETLLEDRP